LADGLLSSSCCRWRRSPQRASAFVQPDYARVHQELRRKGMALMLLREEHRLQYPGEATYSYSQYCENYRRFAKSLKRSMRQVHRAGEKLFIDYVGPMVGLTDGSRAHIFVAALGTSGYTFRTPHRARPWPTGWTPPRRHCAFTVAGGTEPPIAQAIMK